MRETFVKAALIATAVMIVFMILAQFAPGLLLAGFSRDQETMAVASLFLQLVSLNMVAQGLIFTCSSTFQGPRQHQAGVVDLGDAGSHLFRAVDLALDVAGLPDGACLVFVDRDDHATGRPERVAVAPGVQKAPCAAGTGEGREAGKSRAGCASHARARVADRTDARLSPTHGSG